MHFMEEHWDERLDGLTAQANKHIWLEIGRPDVHGPLRRHGGNLEEKSMQLPTAVRRESW